MNTCDRCTHWDYELAENVGKPLEEARGICTEIFEQISVEVTMTAKSSCDDLFEEIEEVA